MNRPRLQALMLTRALPGSRAIGVLRVAFVFAVLNAVAASANAQTIAAPDPMTEAAIALLDLLDDDQTAEVQRPMDAAERSDWHFIPRRRPGLTLGAMNDTQRQRLRELLRAATSHAGYLRAEQVIRMEAILGELEGRHGARDPGRYHVQIFGNPSGNGDAPWAWRLEGHHLSLNFTVVPGEDHAHIAITPAFWAANPHNVPSGPHTGFRPMGDFEDLGFAMLHALDDEQRAQALIADTAPDDLFTRPDRANDLATMEGLPAAALNAEQKVQLRALITAYVANARPADADAFMQRLDEAGLDQIHFAWMGETEPGAGHAHYYRVHGPTVLIEYDNIQNRANHSHCLLREPAQDLGADWLAEHHAGEH